jgi:phytoene dehydrogenase-like protein
VLVLEAGAEVGGATATREFAPGYRVSSAAHLIYALSPEVASELELTKHGLEFASRGLSTAQLSEHDAALCIAPDGSVRGPIAPSELAAASEFLARRARFASLIARQHGRVPARLGREVWRESGNALRFAWDLRRLGRSEMRQFMRVATMSIQDWLDESLTDPRLKALLAMDAVLGTKLGPRSGGTVFTALHRASGGSAHPQLDYAVPRGGMGGLSASLAAAARAAGVEIRCGQRVQRLRVDAQRVVGVELQDGSLVSATAVLAAIEPRTALLELLGARHLDIEAARRIQHVRDRGTAAKLHLALKVAPKFLGLQAADHGHRLLIAPSTDAIEQAFNPVKYGELCGEPVMELHVPSIADPQLAPPGGHVLSAIVQYVPFDLRGGWAAGKPQLLENCLRVLERYAPGLRDSVEHAEILTPVDLAIQLGCCGGHWHHGELALDQFMMLRPAPGFAQYRAPVAGLFLGSAGCHPGGGVMGHAGRNAARVLLGQVART